MWGVLASRAAIGAVSGAGGVTIDRALCARGMHCLNRHMNSPGVKHKVLRVAVEWRPGGGYE